MRIKVNLFSRGLILMALPIVSQLIFIVVISAAMQQAQSNLEKQWREENLLRSTFSICREVTDILLWIQLPEYFRNLIGLDVSSTWLVQAKKDGERLSQLGSEDPEKRNALERLKYSTEYMFGALERMLSSPGALPVSPWGGGAATELRGGLRSNGKMFYDAVEEIVRIEKIKEQNAGLNGDGFSDFTIKLWILSAMSVAVALLAGLIYSISIRRPLKHLSKNGDLLAQQQVLLPVLKNADEFTKIDELLHAASREIENLRLKEREIIENAQDLICTVDRDGTFVAVNPFVMKMLGYEPEYVVGTKVSRYAPDYLQSEQSQQSQQSEQCQQSQQSEQCQQSQQSEQCQQSQQSEQFQQSQKFQKSVADEQFQSAAASQTIQSFEIQLAHLNGTAVETRWSCLWSAGEKKLFCVVRDVTEEKRIEQLKQDFTAMISHDLRSPLMAMGNAFSLIKTGVKGEVPVAAKARIETSSRNVERLIVLVNDLLDFQKLKAGKMELLLEDVELESILREAAELVEEAALSKNVRLSLPAGKTLVQCDRNKLLQTAVNLISNAVKFSDQGGEVQVTVEKGNDSISFSVFDTGPGIAPEFLERIFEPFEQAPSEKKKEGTGLGLAICRLLVESHGGSVTARNRANDVSDKSLQGRAGSVFTVRLPLHPS